MHGGGAVGDFNRDGWPDVFIVGGGGVPDALFINQQNGTFVNEAATWFAPAENQPLLYRGNGANVGDYNKDNCLDIFVTSHGDLPGPPEKGKHRLYRNNCNGTFSNVAAAAGVNETAPYPDGYGAAFGDYDMDGNLDLWVGGWHLDNSGDSLGTRLFHNNGNGTFTDKSVAAGMVDDRVRGFGAIFVDTDDDRYPELLVTGDFGSSRYCINDRNAPHFRCLDPVESDEIVWNASGTTMADFNRDGRMDWYIGGIYPAWHDEGPPGSRLYLNQGNDHFVAAPASAGVNDGGWSWGAASPDLDNDGWPDLVQTNGWPDCDDVTGECFDPEPTYVWRNNGDGSYTDIHEAANLVHMGEGRGLMTLDYDRDGDMDVINLTNNGPLVLFRNDLIPPGGPTPTDANWFEVVLDTKGYQKLPPNGFGTHVKLEAQGVQQNIRINGGSNYLSNSEQIAHFGMAGVTSADLTVMWPSGFQVVRKGVAANQRHTVRARPPYRKQWNSLVVMGLIPGEEATFLTSVTGTGAGPCDPTLGGLCIDLLPPITLAGTAIADANGNATLAMLRGSQPLQLTSSQVTVLRGAQGAASLKSNVIKYQGAR